MPNINTVGEKMLLQNVKRKKWKTSQIQILPAGQLTNQEAFLASKQLLRSQVVAFLKGKKQSYLFLRYPFQVSYSVAATRLLCVPRQKRLDPVATLCWTINQWYLLYLCTIFHGTKQHLHLGSICLKLKCSCYISSASKVQC